jgi:hypothetical protein
MVQFDLKKAFVLTDYPFSPNQPLKGMSHPLLIRSLISGPLQMHKDAVLEKLFVPDAGPFERHFNDFKDSIAYKNYTDNPSSAGVEPFAFFIRGNEGTGKTTLVNRMISHLQKCLPEGSSKKWKIFDTWGDIVFTFDTQSAALAVLKCKINQQTTEEDYCCLVLDNLVAGLETAAINLFSEISKNRVVFLFLISSEEKLLNRNWDNFRVPIIIYDTEDLKADQAVRYIQHRLDFYRVLDEDDEGKRLLPLYPMFPFDLDDIKTAMARQSDRNNQGIVTLRQLNSHLNKAMQQRLKKLPADYDILKIQGEIKAETISISSESYEKMS